MTGYQYVDRQSPSEKVPGKGQGRSQGSLKPGFSAKPADDADEVSEKNEALMAALPLIPREVYDALPPLLECDTLLAIIFRHGLLLCTSLPDSSQPVPVLRKSHLLEQVLAVLPRKFSYTEFVDTAMTCEISISTAKRMLQRAQKAQLIVKQKDGYRKKRPSHQPLGLSDPEPRKRTPKSPKTAGETMKRNDNPVNSETHEEA